MSVLPPPGDGLGDLRTDLRRRFARTAAALTGGRPPAPEDVHLASVLVDHPEALAALCGPEAEALVRGEDPGGKASASLFLHLSLHVALREQLAADLPPGFRAIHESYVSWAGGNRTEAEHAMIPILAAAVEHSLATPGGDDPNLYLGDLVRELVRRGGRPPPPREA